MKGKTPLFLVLAVIMFTGFGIVGCGKKGPPLVPLNKVKILSAPTGLAYTLKDNRVLLTWTHAVDSETANIAAEGFDVFVATKDPDGCEGCPFIFKSAGILAMPQMNFAYDLKPNLKYYFRIQAMGPNDIKSKFSNTLTIDRKLD